MVFIKILYKIAGIQVGYHKTGVRIQKRFKAKCGDCTGVIENLAGIPNRNPTPPYLSLWQGIQAMRVPLTGCRVCCDVVVRGCRFIMDNYLFNGNEVICRKMSPSKNKRKCLLPPRSSRLY